MGEHTKGKDITGQKFGRLTALYRTGEKEDGAYIWHCVCECGNEKDVPIRWLTTGGTSSCGCAKRGVNTKDVTGQEFGWLQAIAPLEKRDRTNVIWRCRCVCGNEIEVPLNRLRTGAVTSCGCKKQKGSKPADLTGKTFGKLTALYVTDKRMNGSAVWHCRCECGGEKDVAAVRLKHGLTKSCGCMRKNVQRQLSGEGGVS